MKRLLTLAAMFLCCIATTFAQFSGSGSGTENDPYLILNPIHLNQIRNFLNKKVYFKLMADIDLTEFLEDEHPSEGWMSIGTSSTRFMGVLDGNGKTITGLWINRPNTDYIGLFGYTEDATIKNLTVNSTSIKGKSYIGIITAHSKNTIIDNCTVSSSVEITGSSDNIGGIVGYVEKNSGSMTNIRVSCKAINGRNYVGGVCGAIKGNTELKSCHSQANISGNDNIGGIVGLIEYDYSVNINNCSFYGEIKGNNIVGGICGHNKSWSTINSCNVDARIVATGNQIGGLVGELLYSMYNTNYHVTLNNSYFRGSVYGSQMIGGIVGYLEYGMISKCYTHSSISGEKFIGGIIGQSELGEVISNVAICTSMNAKVGNIGRIFGEKGKNTKCGEIGTIKENKAWNRTSIIVAGLAQDVTDDLQNGTGVSATTLKLKATYVGMEWDFTDTWAIQETECYPYMKSQTAPPVITPQVVSGATTISGKCVDGGTVILEVDGVKQQMVSSNHEFSFTVNPLQAGHEVRVSAKADDKEQSYYTTETVAYLGKGTEADPYQVYTASDLTGVYHKGYFKLMNDIDLTSYINQFSPTEGWQSIGRDGSETIHFDGNGHKITGLWCNTTRDNTGLFSCFANGEIKNLTVETATGKQVKGGKNTGIIIGKMINGTITNCRVKGAVSDGTPVGGIIGLLDGGKISLCQASVTINTTGDNTYTGGVVGETTSGEIDQCFTEGTLTVTGSESYVAGLVGKNSATITNCYSNATITSSYNAAGIAAYNYGVVDKCYATGNLFSSNYAAGIIGYNDGANAVVKNCAAMNNKIDVTYESQQQQQGGGYGQRIIGGIKNSAPAPELNNYALKSMQVSVNNVAQKVYDDIMNGVGKNGSDLLKASTYQELEWDFTNTWTIKEDENYPSLKNNDGTVVKPGEDPNPDPEPIETDDDKIVVTGVSATKGQQATFSIDLENKTTDLTAYQFDLTLPDGISLSVNDKGKYVVTKTSRYEDDSQTLNISKLEGNSYRFVCFSMSNEKITGTSGTILNATLTIGASVNDGSYEATISNIVVTKVNGTQLKLKDAKFNIVVTNVIKGDANGDGEVNVSDIVEIVNYIMNKPSNKFVFAAADLNSDGEVNVTDIVKVVSIIMSSSNNAPKRAAVAEMVDNDQLLMTSNDNQTLSLNLQNEGSYVASQFDIVLSAGQTLESIQLNSKRMENHQMTYTKTGDNRYKVVIYSLNNATYKGQSGELLNIKVAGSGDVSVEDILFVTAGQMEKRFPPLHRGTTGISVITNEAETMDIYTIDGRLIRKQAKSTDGLEKGLYIINGKKQIVR